ncbi:MAG: CRTAC1 family protein [Planctomycetes bacterium]|nr:CRTAC1 family protein [Planctomycetota bacterium]
MNERPSAAGAFARQSARPAVALIAIVAIYFMTRLPSLADAEREDLATRFRFDPAPLPEPPGGEVRRGRPVHPSLRAHAGWISTVGAAVALSDFDGDGAPNDVCYVDTRTNRVIVAAVPGTGRRYEPFTLPYPAGPHDPVTIAPTGCLFGDFDEDGARDVLVYFWGRTPLLYRRRGLDAPMNADGYETIRVGPADERWFTTAATTADLDGDGHVDLLFGNYFQDGARVLDAGAEGSEEMQDSMSRAFNGGRNRIYLWSGPSSFRSVDDVLDPDIANAWTLAIGAADLDGDLLPELYFGNDFGPDRLLHNRSTPGHLAFANLQGRRGPATPTSKILGHDSFKGMGVDFGDVNDDGRLDMFVSNIAEEYALEESHFLFVSTGETEAMADGIAPYVDRSEPLGVSRSGWGWDTRFADMDNDGVLEMLQATGFLQGRHDRWPELHELAMANDTLLHHARAWHKFDVGDDLSGWQHNPFFVRAADGRYYDIAPQIELGSPHLTRGIATADVDIDGDLDFVIANQWAPSLLHVNEAPNPGRSLVLALLLPPASAGSLPFDVQPGPPAPGRPARPAVGAWATVTCPDGRRLVARVDGGNGHSGARSPEIHFGLGAIAADVQVPLELRWRDGSGDVREVKLSVRPGWHTIMLGAGEPAPGAEGDAP